MRKNNIKFYMALLILSALIFSLLTISVFGSKKESSISTSARSATLYMPEAREFIYSKNSDDILPMASTTKIMTAIVAIEKTKLSDIVTIDESAVGTEGSSAYLKYGDVLTMEELLYALLLQSANDAAVAIAYYVGGDLQGFTEMMNDKAESIGLEHTHFTNPHGLHDDDHYTTARDLAILTAKALENETFRNIVSTYKKTFSSEDRIRTYVNHNKLLNTYDGCIGVKTGFTKKSGRCLVSAAKRDGLEFISVTLDAPDDWNDHKEMLNFGFSSYEKIALSERFDHIYSIPVIGGEKNNTTVLNFEEANIILPRADYNIDEQVKLIRYCFAPIKRGDILGEVIYSIDGQKIASVSLVASEDINKCNNNIFDKILSIFK